MVWSPDSAASAYLDTLKLCNANNNARSHDDDICMPIEPKSTEVISALAAGMSAQLIVEVSSEASQSTVALAAAARQTGGRLVCILPEQESLAASKQVVEDSGLDGMVEFKVGDPHELLPEYENIDFSLVDCRSDQSGGPGLLELLDVNPRRSMVVASNLLVGGRGGWDVRGWRGKRSDQVRCVKHPIGEGMEVTMIGKSDEFGLKAGRSSEERRRRRRPRHGGKSRWVTKIDEESGEEHIFRVPCSL